MSSVGVVRRGLCVCICTGSPIPATYARCSAQQRRSAGRASMGAICSLALGRVVAAAELPGERVALAADAVEPLRGRGADRPPEELTLLVGAEREGLPPDLVAACERVARIPIASHSLNAAMAATVALYETTRHAADAPSSSRVRTS